MTENHHFLRLALPTPLKRIFDYLPPQDIDLNQLKPGVRVKVPFQSRELVGVLIEVTKNSDVPYGKLKRAGEILDEETIFTEDLKLLITWAADYYHASLGEVYAAACPSMLRKGKPALQKQPVPVFAGPLSIPPALNLAQQAAVDEIANSVNQYQTFLLDGVTGSGKTEVYLQAIERVLKLDKQVLVLVPEISLTPQTIARFRSRFPVPIAALHSSLSEKARLDAWLSARSGESKIVIGTRSAIFTPFASLGLIIVDEEHDNSFKQQDRFRYHARDLAIMRASLNTIPIVLGSATPSLETILNTKRGRYHYLHLPERAGNAVMPEYQLLDLRTLLQEEGLSAPLLQAMKEELEKNNQVMLFLNRRGFAPVLYCTQCGYIAGCKRCDVKLVYHRHPERLHCHHCDARKMIPPACQECGEAALKPLGMGTQRLEEVLAQQFPTVPIIRVDRDSTKTKGALEKLIEQIHAEPKAILLGTQMLAKGHHFPQVTLVGIIDADGGLFSADFRATEQMGQLLTQVAGRAGREEKRGKVLIQTYQPEHPLLQTLLKQNYTAFADQLLAERETATLPPYSYFAVLRAEAHQVKHAENFLAMIKKLKLPQEAVSVHGPIPALIAKRKGLHCQHLLIKADKRSLLQSSLKTILKHIDNARIKNTVKWTLDVDPVEVM